MYATVPTALDHATILALLSGVSMKSVPGVATISPLQRVAVRGAQVAKDPLRRGMPDWQVRQTGPERKEFDLNRDIVEGNWKQSKGKVNARWGKLTDDHFDAIAGKRVELADRIQEIYGITNDEAETQIKRFEQHNKHLPSKELFLSQPRAVPGDAPNTAAVPAEETEERAR
jgi:uncharacterized protein YjbJ (UPF0337 family)